MLLTEPTSTVSHALPVPLEAPEEEKERRYADSKGYDKVHLLLPLLVQKFY